MKHSSGSQNSNDSSTVEEQLWQIQQIEAAIVIADSEKAIWVDGEIVETWLNSWGTQSEKPML